MFQLKKLTLKTPNSLKKNITITNLVQFIPEYNSVASVFQIL
jgi:hypothetical protein